MVVLRDLDLSDCCDVYCGDDASERMDFIHGKLCVKLTEKAKAKIALRMTTVNIEIGDCIAEISNLSFGG